MKTLRLVGGILLAAIGVEFILGALLLIIGRDPEVPLPAALVMLVGFGLAPLAGAILLLRMPATKVIGRPCPKCGGTEQMPAGLLRKSHNLWIAHFGGWLFATLWGASRQQQVRCAACDALFFTSTKSSRVAGTLLWIVIVMMIINAVALYYFPDR